MEDAIRGFRAFDFRGGNITIPHKRAAARWVDELTDSARLCGAVNCITRLEDRLIGDNTAGRGFRQALASMFNPAGQRIVLLARRGGAGIAVELALAGPASLTVVNRTEAIGQELVDLLNGIELENELHVDLVVWEGDYRVDAEADLLVHATSIGMNDPDARSPIDIDSLRPETVVADIVFNPPRSRLLDAASHLGCKTLGGLDVLVYQGAIAFETWTGVAPDTDSMREAVEEFLSV